MSIARPLVARFVGELEALLGHPVEVGAKLGVAVSGGPDSLALLLLAAAAYSGRVEAATVDHRVRPANAKEAAAVEALCRTLGVEHSTLFIDEPLPPNPNQAWARALRYMLLERWTAERGLGALLTAHHLDDQAETLLMRVNRASGVGGLAAVRASSTMALSNARLLRPLLGFRRSELRAIVEDAGIEAADDPSNRNPAFDRTKARALLAGELWLKPARLAATARHAAQAELALEWTADRLWRQQRDRAIRPQGTAVLDLRDLPAEFARRLIVRALEEVREAMPGLRERWQPRGASIDRLLRRAGAECSASGWGSTLGGVHIVVHGGTWHFSPAPSRRQPEA